MIFNLKNFYATSQSQNNFLAKHSYAVAYSVKFRIEGA